MVAIVAVVMGVTEVVEAVVVVVAEVEYLLTLPYQICLMIIQCILEEHWSLLSVYLVCHI